MSTKGIASLLSDTLWRTLTFPVTYLLIFVLIASALLQIRYVNRALQRFDSTQVIPTQFVLFTLSVIVGSAVLYRDFKSATTDRVTKFVGGCALTFLGVYLITSGRSSGDDSPDDEPLGDEEEAIGLVDEERYQDEREEHENGDYHARRESKAGFSAKSSLSRKSSRTAPTDHKNTPPQTPRHMSTYPTSTMSSTLSEDADLPLLANPWRQTEEAFGPSARPRTLENAISSPQLPSEAQRSGSPRAKPRPLPPAPGPAVEPFP